MRYCEGQKYSISCLLFIVRHNSGHVTALSYHDNLAIIYILESTHDKLQFDV